MVSVSSVSAADELVSRPNLLTMHLTAAPVLTAPVALPPMPLVPLPPPRIYFPHRRARARPFNPVVMKAIMGAVCWLFLLGVGTDD
jgi:hypothetical protein